MFANNIKSSAIRLKSNLCISINDQDIVTQIQR